MVLALNPNNSYSLSAHRFELNCSSTTQIKQNPHPYKQTCNTSNLIYTVSSSVSNRHLPSNDINIPIQHFYTSEKSILLIQTLYKTIYSALPSLHKEHFCSVALHYNKNTNPNSVACYKYILTKSWRRCVHLIGFDLEHEMFSNKYTIFFFCAPFNLCVLCILVFILRKRRSCYFWSVWKWHTSSFRTYWHLCIIRWKIMNYYVLKHFHYLENIL